MTIDECSNIAMIRNINGREANHFLVVVTEVTVSSSIIKNTLATHVSIDR